MLLRREEGGSFPRKRLSSRSSKTSLRKRLSSSRSDSSIAAVGSPSGPRRDRSFFTCDQCLLAEVQFPGDRADVASGIDAQAGGFSAECAPDLPSTGVGMTQ